MANDPKVTATISLKDEMSAGLSKLTGSLDTFNGRALAVSAAIGAVGYGAYSAVANFEKFNASIERAGTFVNATSSQLDGFRKAAIDAATGTSFSFTQVADALGNFVGGSISAEEATQNLGDVINLALITKMDDLQQVTNLASNALTVFQNEGLSMADVMDVMAAVASNVSTETDAWAEALTQSSGAAHAAGLSFKDLNIILAAMVSGGDQVSLTWSAFNSAMARIQSGAPAVSDSLKAVGLNINELTNSLSEGAVPFLEYLKQGFDRATQSGQGMAFLIQTVGQQAAPDFAIALAQTNEQLKQVGGYFENITGKGEAMASQLRDDIPATEQLGQAFSKLQLIVGQELDGAFTKAAKPMADLVNFLADHTGIVTGFATAVTVALIPALYGLASALGITTAAAAAFAAVTSPWLILAAGIGVAMGIVATNTNKVADATEGATQNMSRLSDAMSKLPDTAKVTSNTVSGAYNSISKAAQDAADKVASANDSIQKTQQSIADLQDTLSGNLVDAKKKEAEAIVTQEKKIADLQEQIRNESDVKKRIVLQNQLDKELQAKKDNAQLESNLINEVSEARRRASLTDMQRTIEDAQNTEILQVNQFTKQMARLDIELAKEIEKKNKIIAGEQEVTTVVQDETKKQTDTVVSSVDTQISKYQQLQSVASTAYKAVPSPYVPSALDFTNVGSTLSSFSSAAHSVLPSFDVGGVVPGAKGAPMLAVVHGGEYVVPNGVGGASGISVTITGNTISSNIDVRNLADQVGREIMRALRNAQQI